EIADLARAFNAMALDIQNQRNQIENHRRELELKVKERTAQLEQEKTKATEAQEALIRTTRLASLGELAGVAAHEVLNPVNNINVRLERLRGELMGAQKEDLKLLGEILMGWEKT